MEELSSYRAKRTRNKQKYVRTRRRRVFIWSAALLLVVAIILVGVFALYGFDVNKLTFLKKQKAGPAYTQPKDRVTALIVGVKDTAVGEDLDSIVVATYSPKTKRLETISIPKNTMVDIPGHGVAEIKQAYALGKISLTKAATEYLIGVKIDHYFKIDENGWRRLIDAMGGVSVAGRDMKGKDVAQYLLPKTKDEKELDRLKRQNIVIAAVKAKAGQTEVFAKLDETIKNLKGAYDSDFSAAETINLAVAVADIPTRSLKTQSLPVKEVVVNGKLFYQPEKTAVEAMITRIFASDKVASSKESTLKVRVLNGVGEPGVASDLAKRLIEAGYHVIDTKNADNFDYAETQLIVYSNKAEDIAAVTKIKNFLGLGKIVVNNLPQDVADVTIVVGKDYLTNNKEYVLLKKVEILNGSGRSGLATTYADKLKAAGYDVVNTGNADRTDYEATVITVYVDNTSVRQMANDIKITLGVGEIKISSAPRTDIEVGIILGKDL